MGKRMPCLVFRLLEQQTRAIKRFAQIAKETVTLMTNREKRRNETRVEAFGAGMLAHMIRTACDADDKKSLAWRKTLTVEDAELYARVLTGAGYEW